MVRGGAWRLKKHIKTFFRYFEGALMREVWGELGVRGE